MQKSSILALIVLTFGCNGSVPTPAQEIPEHSATIPTPRAGNWIQFQEQIHKIAARGPVDLVFLGDSITYGWTTTALEVWDEYYGDRNPANLGIGGDRTEQVLWRIDHGAFDGLHPKLVILQIGTNNTVEKYGNAANSPREIAEGVTAVVQRLRVELPEARILVLGIFPRGRKPRHRLRQALAEANEILEESMIGQPAVSYLDVGERFVGDDGKIPEEVMADGLHLTVQGYRIWAEAIEHVVTELMGKTG